MQQSSSYRWPVLKKGHTCRCQPVTIAREPFSSLLMLLCDGFQESCPCQESSCLFRFASTCPSSISCNWWGVHAASQFIYITSTEQRVGMRVRSRDHCERTILFTVSVFAKVRSMKSVSFAMLRAEKTWVFQTLQPCAWKIVLLLMLLFYGFQESCRCQESRCLFGSCKNEQSIKHFLPFWNNKRLFEFDDHINPQYWIMGTHEVASSDRCERIFFPISLLVKRSDQWRVYPSQCCSWESMSLADTSNLVLGRFFGCWCCCVTASRNPVLARSQVACSGLQAFVLVRCFAIDGAFMQKSSWYRSPVLQKGHTCRCQAVTNVREPFSSQFPSSSKGQINEECLLHNVVCQTPQTLCEEDSLVAEATVLRLPGILSAPGITLLSWFRARMSRALNKFWHAGRTSTSP